MRYDDDNPDDDYGLTFVLTTVVVAALGLVTGAAVGLYALLAIIP
jgi:hypothetical protein